jgi:hypothetical protein
MNRPNGHPRLPELVVLVAFVGVAIGFLLNYPRRVEKGTVTGKVRFQGKPLKEGWITFFDREDNTYRGFIQRDGSYTVSDIPRGPAKIAVSKRVTSGLGTMREPREPYEGVYIPRHYSDPTKSGLSLMVWAGLQEKDFDLKDDFFEGAEITQP